MKTTGEVGVMGAKAKVLVVDDEAVVRESYLRTLSGVRYNVRAALSGREALRMMEAEHFDVILLDLRMPEMDGIEVLREIKKRWPECEVVIITGYPSIETAKEAVRLGAYNYLAKPVGPQEIMEAATGAVTQKRWAMKEEQQGPKKGNLFDYRYPWEN
jgi:two-component system response regulator HydG